MVIPSGANSQPSSSATYVPSQERSGTALCLSGGGYRAALFHLGAMRRLVELGVLAKVDTVSSVSGGSILSAHLATVLVKQPGAAVMTEVDQFERFVAVPFRKFAATDIRTWPLIKRWVLFWNIPFRSTQVNALEKAYRHLTDLSLRSLPGKPRFIFCAAEISSGVLWRFEKSRVGNYQLGYAEPPGDWGVSKAVAASSCFPPLFDPMSISKEFIDTIQVPGEIPAGKEREALAKSVRLSDGGVYDNLGLESVWKSHRHVLSSDGGAPFRMEASTTVIRQWKRYFDIASNQVEALRKRWLISNFIANVMEGTYWGIGNAVSQYNPALPSPYTKPLAMEVLSRIRTDLDKFSPAEMAILENHGYLLADAAIRTHCPGLIGTEGPAVIPHAEWTDEAKVRTALKDSHKRIRW